jgi:hypothetical protein
MPPKKMSPRSSNKSKFEYVTSTVSMFQGDGIVVHVVNDSAAGESARVVIYQNTGAGAIVAADSGNALVTPTWQWGLGFTLPSNGEYWTRIFVSSEFLIPKVSFERLQGSTWVPVVSYRPGDFAIFKLPIRKRIW